jgi:hypothetical protein
MLISSGIQLIVETIGFEEMDDDSRELLRFFKIHEMTGIGNHNPARVGDTDLHCRFARLTD